MFLWEGRTVCWRGRKAIVCQRLSKNRIMIAFAKNPAVKVMAKREEIKPWKG